MNQSQSRDDLIDEDARRRFESAWARGQSPSIEEFLPAVDDAQYLLTLKELVHIELEFAWRKWADGNPLSCGPKSATMLRPHFVEHYLERFPPLEEPQCELDLIRQEYLVRNQFGDRPTLEDYQRRYPHLAQVIVDFETVAGVDGEHTIVTDTRNDSAANESPYLTLPKTFGNYEIIEEVGRGGMGVVFRALQVRASRIVALKVIRREYLAALPAESQLQSITRFRNEVLAAARLAHEHIVTIYDVGEVAGESYFTMQFVEGQSLSDVLREGPLENRRAATYLEPVARAIHAAHEAGILHRDIKPQNILVDAETDHALVMDFGLAKVLDADDQLTRAGDVLGTPAYMSPEQASDAARTTKQSDVYGLGATLYHELTGRPPFLAANPLQTLRQVINDSPVAPSRLNRSVDRDLETICLKCLEKETARRYGGAAELADDLERYLQGQPITARPIGKVEHTVRWCRKNRALAASLSLTLFCLLAAFVATVLGLGSTRKALEEKSIALNEKSRALDQSEKSYRQAREVVNEFFTEVSDDDLLDQPGMQPLRKTLLLRALPQFRRFLAERGEDPNLREELGLTHYRVGLIVEETESPKDALQSYSRALKIQQLLVAQDDDNLKDLYDLSSTWNAIGRARMKLRELEDASAAFQESLEIRSSLVKRDAENREYQRLLANVEMNLASLEKAQGKFAYAAEHYEKAQATRVTLLAGVDMDKGNELDLRVFADYAKGNRNLANLALAQNQLDVAERAVKQAISGFDKLKETRPQDLKSQGLLAQCHKMLGSIQIRKRQLDDADLSYQQALNVSRRLAELNPHVTSFLSLLASVHSDMGRQTHLRFLALAEEGERGQPDTEAVFLTLDQAVESYTQSVAVYRRIKEEQLLSLHRRNMARTLFGLADVYIDREEFDSATLRLKEARDVLAAGIENEDPDFAKDELSEIERIERKLADKRRNAG